MRTLIAALVLFSTLSLHLSTCFAQGPLTPPGALVPMMKIPDQIQPRTTIAVDTSALTCNQTWLNYP
jgi:predicted small lipoprotein YifL